MSKRTRPVLSTVDDYEERLQHQEDTIARLENELRQRRDQAAEIAGLQTTVTALRIQVQRQNGTLAAIRAVLALGESA